MEKVETVEFNINGKPVSDIVKIDFCVFEGCFLLHKTNGEILKVSV